MKIALNHQVFTLRACGGISHNFFGAAEFSLSAPLTFPLRHPQKVKRSSKADKLIQAKVFGLMPYRGLVVHIKKFPAWQLW